MLIRKNIFVYFINLFIFASSFEGNNASSFPYDRNKKVEHVKHQLKWRIQLKKKGR